MSDILSTLMTFITCSAHYVAGRVSGRFRIEGHVSRDHQRTPNNTGEIGVERVTLAKNQ